MNWSAVGAIVSVITLVLMLAGGGVLWGTLTERVTGLTRRVEVHRNELDRHEAARTSLEQRVAIVEEWKRGFELGKATQR
jgi:hypothetical protein